MLKQKYRTPPFEDLPYKFMGHLDGYDYYTYMGGGERHILKQETNSDWDIPNGSEPQSAIDRVLFANIDKINFDE